MTKAINTFSENHDVQESWILRQIDSFKDDSFIDLGLARKEIEEAGITAFATPEWVDNFRDKHLSDMGMKKLSSSLRTHKKRSARRLTARRLDIDICVKTHITLQAMVKESGLTKIEFIEQLILKERKRTIDKM